LGERALLCFASHGGQLHAESTVDGRVRAHRMGSSADVAHRVRALRLALTAGDRAAVASSAGALDDLLIPIGPRPLVVVPTAELAELPWSALPSRRGRAVSVVPSVRHWLRAAAADLAFDRALWVAGPGLRHAKREVRALQSRHGGVALHDQSSTVDSVLSALARADIAHIAAHGTLRPWSSLRLVDGPLRGHHLDRLPRTPSVVVLSACDSGLAPALLRRGTRAVIASVRAVPDEQVVDLMAAVHVGLRAGTAPATALAQAQRLHGDLGFICFGAG
jgi:hypothetical protein